MSASEDPLEGGGSNVGFLAVSGDYLTIEAVSSVLISPLLGQVNSSVISHPTTIGHTLKHFAFIRFPVWHFWTNCRLRSREKMLELVYALSLSLVQYNSGDKGFDSVQAAT